MMKYWILFLIIGLLPCTTAGIEIISSDGTTDNVINIIPVEPPPVTNTTQINQSVYADIWQTNEGDMDNVPDLYSTLDTTYLRLDTSNNPLTDDLVISRADGDLIGLNFSMGGEFPGAGELVYWSMFDMLLIENADFAVVQDLFTSGLDVTNDATIGGNLTVNGDLAVDNIYSISGNGINVWDDFNMTSDKKIKFRQDDVFIYSPRADDLAIEAVNEIFLSLNGFASMTLESGKLTFGASIPGQDYAMEFSGEDSSGQIKYYEDEANFEFNQDVNLTGGNLDVDGNLIADNGTFSGDVSIEKDLHIGENTTIKDDKIITLGDNEIYTIEYNSANNLLEIFGDEVATGNACPGVSIKGADSLASGNDAGGNVSLTSGAGSTTATDGTDAGDVIITTGTGGAGTGVGDDGGDGGIIVLDPGRGGTGGLGGSAGATGYVHIPLTTNQIKCGTGGSIQTLNIASGIGDSTITFPFGLSSIVGTGNAQTISGLKTFSQATTYFAQYMAHYGDPDTRLEFLTDSIVLDAGNIEFLRCSEGATDKLYINFAGANLDTNIRGDTDTNLIYVDASTDRVGIGIATPGEKLDVAGNITVGTGSTHVNFAVCYLTAGTLGHCTDAVNSTGGCTCVSN